jgi:hypothetical protein
MCARSRWCLEPCGALPHIPKCEASVPPLWQPPALQPAAAPSSSSMGVIDLIDEAIVGMCAVQCVLWQSSVLRTGAGERGHTAIECNKNNVNGMC